MIIFRPLAFAAVFALVATLPGQEDQARVSFSISSDQTVLPGEAAQVRVFATAVKKLEFRLYRVKDPLAFLGDLGDWHSFANSTRRKPKTPIEGFQAWKNSLRARLENVARAQFTADNRSRIRTTLAPATAQPVAVPASKPVEFAQLPLLNPEQLVRLWEQPVATKERWESVNVKIPLAEAGLYVVEATDGPRVAYTILSATRLILLTKKIDTRVVARVVARDTGAPLPGATLYAYAAKDRNPVLRKDTDANGIAELASADPKSEGWLLVARSPAGDVAFVNTPGWSREPGVGESRGYLYTDRPIYRPGHTIHFKAILRQEQAGGYALPGVSKIPVTVEDPEGNSIFKKDLALSQFGTIHAEVTLAGTAPTGYYSIRAGEPMQAMAYGGFRVEEYRTPDYDVRVQPETVRTIAGNSVRVTIDARYYYGEPVSRAKVLWSVREDRYWPPWWDEEADEEFGEGFGVEPAEVDPGKETTAELNEDGKLVITVPTRPDTYEKQYRVEARVVDSANREIAGAATFLATQGSFALTVRPRSWVGEPEKPFHLDVEAKDYEGKPVGAVPVTGEVLSWDWKARKGTFAAALSGETAANGQAALSFTPKSGGTYLVKVIARDGTRSVHAESYVWVSGGGWGNAEERIQLITDRKKYLPGQTARVLVVTTKPNPHLWFSVEGRDLKESRFQSIIGQSATFDVPISSADVPELYVSVAFVHANQLYVGTKRLPVETTDREIDLQVSTDREQYKPGGEATLSLSARDHEGKPLAAEVSIGVVDEAIYAVKREDNPDVVKAFYGPGWNHVNLDSSFQYYFTGQAGERRMQLAKLRPSGIRAQLKPERLVAPKIRKVFPGTAYWIADLKTDSSGKAQTRFAFPDSLTTWRTTARAVTAGTKVGTARTKTIVRKNLLLTLASPRFLTEGDSVVVPVLVRNYLTSAKNVRVTLEAKGGTIDDASPRDLTVQPRGEVRVDYHLRPTDLTQVVLTAKALTDQESDGIEIPLPVVLKGTPVIESRGGSGDAKLTLSAPPETKAPGRQLEIRVSPTLASTLFSALDYLVTYPYGCTEQIMSSFVPNLMVTKVIAELGGTSPVDVADLKKKANAGLERLYEMQHDDGGWGWWSGDDSDLFLTAYVVQGLWQAQQAGYRVRPWVRTRGEEWLKQRLPVLSQQPADLAAYATYILTEGKHTKTSDLDAVLARRGELTPLGLAIAGLTARALNDGRASQIAQQLTSTAIREDSEAHWSAQRDQLFGYTTDVSPEATAYAVKFLTAETPDSPLLDPAARWLVAHRNQGYYWNSTKQTAMVIFGLLDYLKRSGDFKPDYTVTVNVNGKSVWAKQYRPSDAISGEVGRILVDAQNANQVEIVTNNQGRPNWSALLRYQSMDDRIARGGSTLNVTREYLRFAGGAWQPLTGPVQSGERIAVRLLVNAPGWDRLVLEDPLPAGAEALNDQDQWWGRRDIRDNRVAFLISYFPKLKVPKPLEFRYIMRVTNAGTFAVNPARLTPMYEPNQLVTTDSRVLEVTTR